jgi:hypothetical protein
VHRVADHIATVPEPKSHRERQTSTNNSLPRESPTSGLLQERLSAYMRGLSELALEQSGTRYLE